jgi:hypothetical protein
MKKRQIRITDWREKNTVNTGEFAEILGVSRNKFSQLKKQQKLPNPIPGLGLRTTRWSTQTVSQFINGVTL